MSRWELNARERLQEAALALFVEQGFGETTIPQITARASLTTRTFFRHFADKREVLFAGEDDVPARIAELMAHAPDDLRPMALITWGLVTLAENSFQSRYAYFKTRRAIVQTDEGLRERDMRKLSVISEAIAQGFRRRGFDGITAALAAQISMTAFGIAIHRWLDQNSEQPLAEIVKDTLHAVRSALGTLE